MTDPDATVPVLLKMRAELAQHLRPERLRPLGYADRAQFIRDAIAEKLGVPKSIALMKSREGVGGAPSHKARAKAAARNAASYLTADQEQSFFAERGVSAKSSAKASSSPASSVAFGIGTALPSGTPDREDTIAIGDEGRAQSPHERVRSPRSGRVSIPQPGPTTPDVA